MRSLSDHGQIWGIGGYSLNKRGPFVRKRALLATTVHSLFRDLCLQIMNIELPKCAMQGILFSSFLCKTHDTMVSRRNRKVPDMRVVYNKLWKKLIDERMNKKDLRIKAGVSTNIIARMGKEEPVSMESIGKICRVFHCSVDDILDIDLDTVEVNEEVSANG